MPSQDYSFKHFSLGKSRNAIILSEGNMIIFKLRKISGVRVSASGNRPIMAFHFKNAFPWAT